MINRRKLPVTTLLYALGLDQEGIMDAYYNTVDYSFDKGTSVDNPHGMTFADVVDGDCK